MSKKTEKKEEDYAQMEQQYWDKVDRDKGRDITVEYAADLSADRFGSGFGREGQPLKAKKSSEYVDHPWNMNNYFKLDNSLMNFKEEADMSGIDVPWLYVGQKFSTFCWHYEDLMLYSINYNHWGKPKLWYGVPLSDRVKFEKLAKEKVTLLFKEDPNILLDIVTMLDPTYFLNNGVKVSKTLQMPGEFIVTFPGSYHAGFSTGLNIGEACNFLSKSWL